jgi:hypothetical protein
MPEDINSRFKQRLYYGYRGVQITVAALPFIFFCSLLERFFRAVITGPSSPTLWWQTKASATAQAARSSQEAMASQDLWFTGLFLVCLTVLLVASMVLIGRVSRRD